MLYVSPATTGRSIRYRFAVEGLFVAALALCACGCDMAVYSLQAVTGELNLLSKAVPIDQAVQDPNLSEEQREKLAFVIRARDFGEQVVGLYVGNSYQRFANLGDRRLAWNLSGSRRDALQAYVWYVPVVGATPFLGYFQFEQALAERDRLLAWGYDTIVYEVDAYSTLGILPDPVASPLLERNLVSLADTVLHELLHNTIYRAGDNNFDESLATFVGRTACVEFLQLEFGADASIITEARQSYEDADRFSAFLQGLATELNNLYGGDASSEEKISAREAVFESARQQFAADVLPLMHDQATYETYTTFAFNNAFVLLNTRYNTGLDVFQAIYDLTGRDWGGAMRLFSQAALQDDPIGFLRGVVEAASTNPAP